MTEPARISDEPAPLPTPSISVRAELAVVVGILLLAFAVQVWLVYSGRVYLDADECTLTMMGLRVQRGELPLVYDGQDYMGPVEAYLYAAWNGITRSRSVANVKLFAALLSAIYLASCYALARRFIDRKTAMLTLLLLAVPSQLLAVWLLRIRGYLPWLLAGNLILWLILRMMNGGENRNVRRNLFILGAVCGLAWWINPLSIQFVLTVALAFILFSSLRSLMWRGLFNSSRAMAVNLLALVASTILIARTLAPTRNYAFLQTLFEYRVFVLPLAVAVLVGCLAAVIRDRARDRAPNFTIALLVSGFVLGAAPYLIHAWTHPVMNLKQSLAPLASVPAYVSSLFFFVFPSLMGLTEIRGGAPIFPVAINVAIALIFVMMLYNALRHGVRRYRLMGVAWLLFAVALGLYVMQDAMPKYEHRYLLSVFFPLALGLALLFSEADRVLRGASFLLAGIVVCMNVVTLHDLPARPVTFPGAYNATERELVDYCLENNLIAVYIDADDNMANRMTFFAGMESVFLYVKTYFNRVEAFTERFRAQPAYGFIVRNEPEAMNWIGQSPDAVVGEFAVFHRVPKERVRENFPHADGL